MARISKALPRPTEHRLSLLVKGMFLALGLLGLAML